MDEQHQPPKNPFLAGFFVAMLILTLLFAFGSCKSVQTVVVEKVSHDTTYIAKVQHDSIHLHDSVYIQAKSDTIFYEKWHTKYIERVRFDTITTARVYRVPIPYEVVVKERYIPKFYKTCTWLLWILLVGVILAIVARILIRIYLHR